MLDSTSNFYNLIQSSDNILLFKSDLGKSKPGIHRLPPENFIYGKSTGEDKEGAGDLMRRWKVHQSSQKLISEPNYRILNRMSAMQGLSTATEFRTFRRGKDIRIATSQTSLSRKVSFPDMTYGLPSGAVIPINALISNFYGRVAAEDLNQHYAVTPILKSTKWVNTRSLEQLKSTKTKVQEPKVSREFKMRKFRDVKSRTDCRRPVNK